MEALTALSLAANVIQFVQFSCGLISLSSSIRNSTEGSAADLVDLEVIAKDVARHHSRLRNSAHVNRDLETLAERSSDIAKDLLDVIERVRVKRSKITRWGSFRQALETVWKKDQISGLQSRLESLRDEIQYHLIVDMQHSQYDFRKSLIELQKENKELETAISTKLEDIMIVMKSIRDEFNQSDELPGLQQTFIDWYAKHDNSSRDYNILRSLQFSSMTIRHTAIVTAYEQTFDWIFDAASLTSQDARKSVKFASWLQYGTGMYWITGKPGSGKSTLMKFLDPSHHRTKSLLKLWAEPLRLVFASFYFWNAGSHMQKSLEGLLQSLLHRILAHCPELIKLVCPERWAENTANAYLCAPWSVIELERCFERLAAQQEIPAKFYFHVDGLDEYDGDHFKVVDIIENLAQVPNFKICVSSRPWNQFQQTIGETSSETLQLHLYTREDIEIFTRGSILSPRFGLNKGVQKQHYEEIVQEITNRAQGVFLWVRLVVHSLRDGFFNRDPISLLRKRLEELPTDLEVFFEHILSSVQPIYSERMARTFLTTLAAPGLRVIHYFYLDEEDPYFGWTLSFSPPGVVTAMISERASETRWILNGRYKGLLEPASESNLSHATVNFLHRTLRDFLATPRMELFLRSRAPKGFDPMKSAVGAMLAEVKFLQRNLQLSYFTDVMHFVERAAEDPEQAALKFALIDHIELICQRIYPNVAQPSMHHSLLLRAAVHYGLDDYITHRINSAELPVDSRWVLCHMCLYPFSASVPFSQLLRLYSIRKLSQCDCATFYAGGAVEPKVDIIKSLLEKGVSPHADFQGTSIWARCVTVFGKYDTMSHSQRSAYWKVMELMSIHGASTCTESEAALWSRIIHDRTLFLRNAHASGLDGDMLLLEWLRGLQSLLQQGWKPHEEVLPALLFTLGEQAYEYEIEECIRGTVLLILRNGTKLSVLTKLYHRPESKAQSWLDLFLGHISEGKVFSGGLGISVLYGISLRHGLDPNHAWHGSTIWEHLLQALKHSWSIIPYHESHHDLLLLALQYGANPESEVLRQILGLREGCNCLLPKSQASEVKDAVLRAKQDSELRDHKATTHHVCLCSGCASVVRKAVFKDEGLGETDQAHRVLEQKQ